MPIPQKNQRAASIPLTTSCTTASARRDHSGETLFVGGTVGVGCMTRPWSTCAPRRLSRATQTSVEPTIRRQGTSVPCRRTVIDSAAACLELDGDRRERRTRRVEVHLPQLDE